MNSAFGVDHGDISKATYHVTPSNFSDKSLKIRDRYLRYKDPAALKQLKDQRKSLTAWRMSDYDKKMIVGQGYGVRG